MLLQQYRGENLSFKYGRNYQWMHTKRKALLICSCTLWPPDGIKTYLTLKLIPQGSYYFYRIFYILWTIATQIIHSWVETWIIHQNLFPHNLIFRSQGPQIGSLDWMAQGDDVIQKDIVVVGEMWQRVLSVWLNLKSPSLWFILWKLVKCK